MTLITVITLSSINTVIEVIAMPVVIEISILIAIIVAADLDATVADPQTMQGAKWRFRVSAGWQRAQTELK